MAEARGGYIQQLPGGSFPRKCLRRDGRQTRLRPACKTERAAQIGLGRPLEHTAARRQPETNANAAQLMDKYAEVAD